LPPLESGDSPSETRCERLTRPEFERRYAAASHIKKAELIEGIVRSRMFPGLWLAVEALLSDQMARVLSVLQEGLNAPDHAAFLTKLGQQD
jgi:hypothetical protein